MKKILSVVLVLVLILSVCGLGAIAESALPLAAQFNVGEQFEEYPGYELSPSGQWELVAHETVAMEQFIANVGTDTGTISGFYFSMIGESDTGLLIPMLNVFFLASYSTINMEAVSFIYEENRYDFTGARDIWNVGKYTLERLRIPLDQSGYKFWNTIRDAESIEMILSGSKAYSYEFTKTGTKSTMQYISSACLSSGATLYSMIDSVCPMTAYKLWDLNEAYCETNLGIVPDMQSVSLYTATNNAIFAETENGILGVGSNGKAVRTLHELLSDACFYVGSYEESYTARTRDAVKLAQQYYGLMVNGFADYKLTDCLTGKSAHGVRKPDTYTLNNSITLNAGDCEFGLTRYWFAAAAGAAAAEAGSILDNITRNYEDEILLTIDGNVINNGNAQISSKSFSAYLEVNGSVYAAKLQFERENGASLQDTLQIGCETRFLMAASIPMTQAVNAKSISLIFTFGEDTQEISLL